MATDDDDDDDDDDDENTWHVKTPGGLYLQTAKDHVLILAESPFAWTFETPPPMPPTCNLVYRPTEGDIKDEDIESWELTCAVQVEKSTEATYFCVIGWLGGSDGYCGIQQDADEKRVAIYSLWNNGEGTVQCEDQGEGVVVSNFVEDGTGLRSLRDLDWNLGETITFTIKGEKDGNLWKFSCWFQRSGKDLELMARYSMPCHTCPLNPHGGFYSFVENYAWAPLEEGYRPERRAIFKEQQMTINQTKVRIEEANFEFGDKDAQAAYPAERVRGEKKVYWILATGGDPKESSPQQ